jgi:hypothetical protein
MTFEENNYYNETRNLGDKCKKYLYYHVTLTMTDGSTFDGIIDNVEPDRITMLVGEDVMGRDDDDDDNDNGHRQYGQYGYPRPRRRFRRFRRRAFPLANLAELLLLPYPYYYSYPYSYYPYSYYPY